MNENFGMKIYILGLHFGESFLFPRLLVEAFLAKNILLTGATSQACSKTYRNKCFSKQKFQHHKNTFLNMRALDKPIRY